MKNRIIDVTSAISPEGKEILHELLELKIRSIYIKSNYFILGNFTFPSLEEIIIQGDKIGITCIREEKQLNDIVLSTLTKVKDYYGEYEKIDIVYNTKKSSDWRLDELFREDKNESIFAINIPKDLVIKSIDVYGVNVKGMKRYDKDFPDEVEQLSINTDALLKFNLNQGFFFIIHAKSGSMLLNFYNRETLFEDYIKMTIESWGEEYGYKYKYTISNKRLNI